MNQLCDINAHIASASCSDISSQSGPSVITNDDNDFSSDEHGSCSSVGDHAANIPDYCQVMKFTDDKGNVKELLFPKNLDLNRPKRARTNFTIKQLNALESAFNKNQYLVGRERKALSKELDLSEAQIKVWYQNRRTKYKREQCKEKERLEANAESIAANNIMQMLQNRRPSLQSSPYNALEKVNNNQLLTDNYSNITPSNYLSNNYLPFLHH